MPRVPPDEIERLKQEVSVQRLAEARGIELKPHGKDLIGLCPFHEDREPSLIITPGKNLWHCLGACGTGGTVIDWVMMTEGVSFRHAVEILKNGTILQVITPGRPPKIGTTVKLPPPVTFDADDQQLLCQVVDYYHQTLKESPEALAYLEKRGLKNAEMIDRFKIGYANRTLGLRLPDKNRQAGAAIRERLTKLGIMRDTGHEHFSGSIVFPVINEQNQVTEIYGRKIRDDLRAGTAYHLYLPGAHQGVWNVASLDASRDVILCEAIIDALSFWCAGFRNVTASYGINGFTPDHLKTFEIHNIARIFIAYDRDDAGDKAAETLAEKLIAKGYEVFRVLFPRNMDANDYALKMNPPAKAFDLVIRNAVWIGKGKRANEAPEISEQEPATKGKIAPPSKTAPDAAIEVPRPAPQEPPAVAIAPADPEPAFPLAASSEPSENPAPIPATPAPAASAVNVKPEETVIQIGDRRWRVRGLTKNTSYDQLKVNLLVSRGDAYFVDTFDLYAARSRAAYQKQAADELRLKEDVIRSDLGKILLQLEEFQAEKIRKAAEPQEQQPVTMSEAERAEALELLKDPRLLDRILSDFARCGIVGEETNKLTGYLAAISRKLDTPLAVIVQSSSAAGKTSLMDAILAFMPDEERVKYSAMTGQSLFYMGETDLQHKILAIVEEAGAERASYALKLLQSEGELSIASTGKDPASGKLVTHEYRVKGPVMIFITTTNIDIDEELLNRCLVLTVNESREQTRAIHEMQRERRTLEGFKAKRERARIIKLHQNAQRLLQPLHVINPYARRLTFMDDKTRTRRDQEKYLNLIECIALLHQYQRARQAGDDGGERYEYLEVTIDDIETANRLADEVLGRSLDEMPPQTRRLLMLIDDMVHAECGRQGIERSAYWFSRREVRECTGWGNTQLKLHLHRLEEFEYVFAHRGGRGQGFVYELAYDGRGKDGQTFLHGLIDVGKLRTPHDYDDNRSGVSADRSGQTAEKSAPSRPEVGGMSGGGRVRSYRLVASVSDEKPEKTAKTALKGEHPENRSYSNDRQAVNAAAKRKTPGNGSSATVEAE